MKTVLENEAEIASDVKKAKRERAEATFAERKELEKEGKEMEKFRYQKRASFYYKISYLFLTASGVGGGLNTLFLKEEINWITVLLGIFMATIFAVLADHTLKCNNIQ